MRSNLTRYAVSVLDASGISVAIRESFSEENNDNRILSFLWQRKCYCSSINWFEVESLIDELSAEETLESPWPNIKRLFIEDYHLTIKEIFIQDVEWIAMEKISNNSRLSMQRLSCLALGRRLDLPVITADPTLTQESWISREVEVILI